MAKLILALDIGESVLVAAANARVISTVFVRVRRKFSNRLFTQKKVLVLDPTTETLSTAWWVTRQPNIG